MTRKQLVENKFPDQYQKALKIQDPSGKNKYLLWIAQQLKNGYNSADITATIAFFHGNPNRFSQKDIHKYHDLKELENIIKDMGLSKCKKKEKHKENAEKIYEDDSFLCVRVDDKQAMIAYGASTRWCTTMKDKQYYEDYVQEGNAFYIVISKDPTKTKSTKYAITRKGLLDFEIYDAQDSCSREFTEEEEDKLREVVRAIVADKAPKNMLKEILRDDFPVEQAGEWLSKQSAITREYAEQKRPELLFATKSPDRVADFLEAKANGYGYYRAGFLEKMGRPRILELARYLATTNRDWRLKLNVINYLDEEGCLVFAKDRNFKVREKVAISVTPEEAKKFMTDSALSVVENAAKNVDPKYLLDSIKKCRSKKRKEVLEGVVEERISNTKALEFVLKQPDDIIISLMS